MGSNRQLCRKVNFSSALEKSTVRASVPIKVTMVRVKRILIQITGSGLTARVMVNFPALCVRFKVIKVRKTA